MGCGSPKKCPVAFLVFHTAVKFFSAKWHELVSCVQVVVVIIAIRRLRTDEKLSCRKYMAKQC